MSEYTRSHIKFKAIHWHLFVHMHLSNGERRQRASRRRCPRNENKMKNRRGRDARHGFCFTLIEINSGLVPDFSSFCTQKMGGVGYVFPAPPTHPPYKNQIDRVAWLIVLVVFHSCGTRPGTRCTFFYFFCPTHMW